MDARGPAGGRGAAATARRRSAFTLVELLVTSAVILLLAALLVPAVTPAVERARRALCGSNIRQHLLAYTGYGFDRGGRIDAGRMLPWLWDIDRDLRDTLVHDYGLSRPSMYDPSYPEQNIDRHWDFPFQGGYTVTGYWLVIVRRVNGEDVIPMPIVNNRYRQEVIGTDTGYVSVLEDLDRPCGTAMVTDATISHGRTQFARVQGAYLLHRTPHLDRTGPLPLPAGFNVGHADGSCAWKAYTGPEDNLMTRPWDGRPSAWW